MHFLTLLSVFPAALALAVPQSILPTGQTVKQDIINIHNAVLQLDATVQAYDGSPFPTSLVDGTPVLLGVAKIHEVNRAGFRHALAALPFSVSDSNDVITTVMDTGTSLFSSHPLFHPFPFRVSTATNARSQYLHPSCNPALERETACVQRGSVDSCGDCKLDAVAVRSRHVQCCDAGEGQSRCGRGKDQGGRRWGG